MDKEQVIALAREAGFADGVVEIVGLEGFARFAELVAAAEREACAMVAENTKAPFTAVAIRARGQA